MGFRPYLRCPVCGKLARPTAIGHAGTHTLEQRRCTKALGYYGFEWSRERLPYELLRALEAGLLKALAQVRALIDSGPVATPDRARVRPSELVRVQLVEVSNEEETKVEPARERVRVAVRSRVV